jgi:RNA polymerase sigma-70 factor (ECF subfamily)
MGPDKSAQEDLLADLRQDRPGAFQQVVEAEKHKVLNICFRFVRNREDAEELAQETFVEVFRSVGRFRGDSALSTWIHRIAVTKSINFLRRENRQRRGGPKRAVLSTGVEVDEIPAGPTSDPQTQLEIVERQRLLWSAIGELPQNQRVALTLSTYDDSGHDEISAIMDTTVSAVEALLHRAKAKLRKRLTKFYREDRS